VLNVANKRRLLLKFLFSEKQSTCHCLPFLYLLQLQKLGLHIFATTCCGNHRNGANAPVKWCCCTKGESLPVTFLGTTGLFRRQIFFFNANICRVWQAAKVPIEINAPS